MAIDPVGLVEPREHLVLRGRGAAERGDVGVIRDQRDADLHAARVALRRSLADRVARVAGLGVRARAGPRRPGRGVDLQIVVERRVQQPGPPGLALADLPEVVVGVDQALEAGLGQAHADPRARIADDMAAIGDLQPGLGRRQRPLVADDDRVRREQPIIGNQRELEGREPGPEADSICRNRQLGNFKVEIELRARVAAIDLDSLSVIAARERQRWREHQGPFDNSPLSARALATLLLTAIDHDLVVAIHDSRSKRFNRKPRLALIRASSGGDNGRIAKLECRHS